MSNNPINLALRFALELAALVALGYWGWQTGAGAMRYALALSVPLAAAAAWGVFRVPNDGGKPVVVVPGWARLLLEAVFFGFAIWGLFDAGATTWGRVLALLVAAHYLLSYDRILRLLRG